ncbi:C2H2 zinc finger protein Zas1A [Cryptococcus neoformans var. grubii Br795]|uniref:C2H2 zinc finger protein Zas1A n=1 Tax=Cryptococcus neoformans Tu259-1 TaxID=1230072 RepID=A0A854QMR4_CRYNE|nr:C2H2 zinc finger protein Zas1A [Cryptococcus neoformans var. grubii AD1-83a]OWZ56127.1 C2H2 zinc finger protein Zas1A [Cryptococcus neoformans var. grubii 125.91]OXG24981.1 C2H2 zinc finger protein Zas1A [Cryptococcus neoformans var. grubii Tu259-1]OXG51514.1 C2H2 zinc finger protein Zas1A [Cryptococcus neoformans var. grubii CHC193]OXG73288.1 C2H2 zinc finger protein Zas1A [Cryptococcus neoformans var. grubii MW-RSA36]OXG74441.1 C2H2 zinc finger protein Zas1A [Cryptococcus neoformans var. 
MSSTDVDITPSGAFAGGVGAGKAEDEQGKETFACTFPGCFQIYSRVEYLKRHLRKHENDRPFPCKDCRKTFTRRIEAHEASPSREGPRKPGRHRTTKGERALTQFDPILRNDYDDKYNSRNHPGACRSSGTVGSHLNYSPQLLPSSSENRTNLALDDSDQFDEAPALFNIAYATGIATNNVEPQEQSGLHLWGDDPAMNLIMAAAAGGDNNSSNHGGSDPSAVGAQPHSVASTSEDSCESISSLVGSESGLPGEGNVDSRLPDLEVFNPTTWPSGIGTQGGTNMMDVGRDSFSWGTSLPAVSHHSPSISYRLPSHSSNSITKSRSQSNVHGRSQQLQSQDVLQILHQIAVYDVPQIAANPNPERPLLRVAHAELADRLGNGIDPRSRFYLPTDRFNGGYQIPHWALPPLRTLSLMACRTFHTILNHFPIVHLPTFQLIDTSPCLAFAICTVGGIRTGNSSIHDHHLWEPPTGNGRPDPRKVTSLDGPVLPDQSWESLYEKNWYHENGSVRVNEVPSWKNAPTVRNEKINMLVKSFYLARGMLMTEFNVTLLQALILYHTPNFLSEDERERAPSNMFTGTIVNVSRRIGFFTPENDHFTPIIRLPDEPYTPNELERCWREWIQLESVRRTAYLVYQLDTISALEANIPCLLSPYELAYIPLPAPDTLWKAPDAETWLETVKGYRPMTLDEAMRRTFFLPTSGKFDQMHEKSDKKAFQLLRESNYGPFARIALMITLLRGIIDIGEGKRDRGDWRDLTDLWVGDTFFKPGKMMLDQYGINMGLITRKRLKDMFRLALQTWREGWDYDNLCAPAPMTTSNDRNTMTHPENSWSEGSLDATEEEEMPKKTMNYCEDALPLYWLAQTLRNLLDSNSSQSAGTNIFSSLRYNDMLKAARTSVRTGEGLSTGASNPSDSFGIRRDDRNHTGGHTKIETTHDIPKTRSMSHRNTASLPIPIPLISSPFRKRKGRFNPTDTTSRSAHMNDGSFGAFMHMTGVGSVGIGMPVGLQTSRYGSGSNSVPDVLGSDGVRQG